MKRTVTMLVCLCLIAPAAIAAEKGKFKTKKEQLSYSLGYDMATNFKRTELDVDPAMIMQGMKDAQAGKPKMSEEEMREVLMEAQQKFRTKQQELMAKQQEQRKSQGEKNKKEGEAFLEENKKKPGIVTLPSGLQYKMLVEGKGKSPKATDKVTVNYRGTLIDGTEFDSSYKRNQPATFALNQVIKAWTEGVQLMKEGGKIQLFVPSELGYGDRGAGAQIGPNAVLIFEVELISVAAE
ncbi:MAG: FKBP-type peptidyl-prolyl cis-trans isomerase [Nitrospirota bacterium]|nr:FKBP-type peptidyl-prolyl cis-trans isomerase [Nitrospirota bacterium]